MEEIRHMLLPVPSLVPDAFLRQQRGSAPDTPPHWVLTPTAPPTNHLSTRHK